MIMITFHLNLDIDFTIEYNLINYYYIRHENFLLSNMNQNFYQMTLIFQIQVINYFD